MLMCPYCHHEEVIGALFCSECGTQLPYDNYEALQKFQENATLKPEESLEAGILSSPQTGFHQTGVSLYILDSEQMIALEGQSEFTLGRNSEGQAVFSDVDLTPFRGYELGVSRLHTSIKIEDGQIFATDLGSANGTRINGLEIPSNNPHRLQHGDIITLGKMKIQILIHR
jgi:pSer/pThr/pTyr-binding forkhead associated (FHA) protein